LTARGRGRSANLGLGLPIHEFLSVSSKESDILYIVTCLCWSATLHSMSQIHQLKMQFMLKACCCIAGSAYFILTLYIILLRTYNVIKLGLFNCIVSLANTHRPNSYILFPICDDCTTYGLKTFLHHITLTVPYIIGVTRE